VAAGVRPERCEREVGGNEAVRPPGERSVDKDAPGSRRGGPGGRVRARGVRSARRLVPSERSGVWSSAGGGAARVSSSSRCVAVASRLDPQKQEGPGALASRAFGSAALGSLGSSRAGRTRPTASAGGPPGLGTTAAGRGRRRHAIGSCLTRDGSVKHDRRRPLQTRSADVMSTRFGGSRRAEIPVSSHSFVGFWGDRRGARQME